MKHDMNLLMSLRHRPLRKTLLLRIALIGALVLFLGLGIIWPQIYLVQNRAYLNERQATAQKYAPIEDRFLSSAYNRNFRSQFGDIVDEWSDTPLAELNIIKQALPANARVTNIELRNDTIKIQGLASSNADVVSFVAALRKAQGYYGVTLDESNKGEATWSFTVEWILVAPATPTPLPTIPAQ